MDNEWIGLHKMHIKCDADGCDWIKDDIDATKMHEWINQKCPQCGNNLLTIDDFKRAELVLELTKEFNKLSLDDLKDISGDNSLEQGEVEMLRVETHNDIKIFKSNGQ